MTQAVYVLTVTVEEGQKTVDQSKSPPPAPVVPSLGHRKVSSAPIVKSSTSTLPKSSSASSFTALPGMRPRRAAGRNLGARNPDFQVFLALYYEALQDLIYDSMTCCTHDRIITILRGNTTY